MRSLPMYILSIDLTLDSNHDLVIDNRVVKRKEEEASFTTKYLKGTMKEHQSNQHILANHLTPFHTVNINKTLTTDEVKKIMQPGFDLFKDLHTLIHSTDDPTLQAIIK